MSYETFASVYDEVMDQTLYKKWFGFTEKHRLIGQKKILELACGTGALALELANAGYEVTALDLSEEMLSIASERAFEASVPVQFVQGDMQDLSEVGTYEIITCFSDSICYMENRQAVQEVFDEVYRALEEGGSFLFDVHSIYQIDQVFPEYNYHYQTDQFAFLWESYAGEKKHSIEHFLTFFLKEDENEYFTRVDELHRERTYTLEDYLGMLENAGFEESKVYGDFTEDKPKETAARWLFSCKK